MDYSSAIDKLVDEINQVTDQKLHELLTRTLLTRDSISTAESRYLAMDIQAVTNRCSRLIRSLLTLDRRIQELRDL